LEQVKQNLRFKYIYPHGGQDMGGVSGDGLGVFWFLLKALDPESFVYLHDAVLTGHLLPLLDDGDGYVCLIGLMVAAKSGVIHLINMVTGQDQYVFRGTRLQLDRDSDVWSLLFPGTTFSPAIIWGGAILR